MKYRIRNWERFQHYKDRNPPWIKLHYELLSSSDWVMLDDSARVLAVACMLLGSRTGGEIDCSERGLAYLQRVAYLNGKPDPKPLIDSGFLIPASGCKQKLASARPETEAEAHTEAEEEAESDPEKKDQNLNSARARELRNTEIETNGYVAASDIPSVGAFLAGINTKVAEREALDFDDISYTLNAFFPPERPGAGTNPAVKAWLGRIPEQTLGSALRYLRVQTYTVDGEEKTWGQLTDEHCKRVITAGLNAILRERG